MDGQTPNLQIFRCVTGLRGYYVYQVDWKPILGQKIARVNYMYLPNVLPLNRVNFMYLKIFSPSIALILCIYKCSAPIRVNFMER